MKQYKPLFIIVGMIAFVALLASVEPATGRIFGHQCMASFMAGFFFVFAGFKLLDLSGFAKGYSKYDLLARQWHGYGFVYPFIELALGTGYVLTPFHPTLNIVTAALMLFGSMGVMMKLAKREQLQCACLGTFIKVQLIYVTLIENIGMALMAIGMLGLNT